MYFSQKVITHHPKEVANCYRYFYFRESLLQASNPKSYISNKYIYFVSYYFWYTISLTQENSNDYGRSCTCIIKSYFVNFGLYFFLRISDNKYYSIINYESSIIYCRVFRFSFQSLKDLYVRLQDSTYILYSISLFSADLFSFLRKK